MTRRRAHRPRRVRHAVVPTGGRATQEPDQDASHRLFAEPLPQRLAREQVGHQLSAQLVPHPVPPSRRRITATAAAATTTTAAASPYPSSACDTVLVDPPVVYVATLGAAAVPETHPAADATTTDAST